MADDIRNYIITAGVSGFELNGKDCDVEIAKFKGDFVYNTPRGKKTDAAIWFKRKQKPLILTANCQKREIARMHGMDPAGWIGKWITIYPLRGVFYGDLQDVVRVRPDIPKRESGPPATSAGASAGEGAETREEATHGRWAMWMTGVGGGDEPYETWVRRILRYDDAAPLDVADMSDVDLDKLELVLTENEA